MKLNDERLIDFLNKRFVNLDIDKFICPTEQDFRDVNNIRNIREAAHKISLAIKEKKHILIYGDYDCDGICSATILLQFLKSRGANVDVFIPNRFENGYGISIDAIEEIIGMFSPDLVITVDLGITAVEEVEILKQEGVDIIITDHHLPLSELPDCLIVDPKICAETYGFDALCGAGVALKLVEAIAGREEAIKYIDLCAIATVGDIVSLTDENRAIASLGIKKINSGNCLKSIKFLLQKLDIITLDSYDISFKIVPRLNACGRMDNAFKVVEFLVEQDDKQLEIKYAEIESDNTLRLKCIERSNKQIEKFLESFDNTLPSIIIKGNFHEGIIGILASKICNEYHKPVIVFTETESGTLKGSGRSIESIDIHQIIASMPDLLQNFGGHKMAIGVEILPEDLDQFKTIFNNKINALEVKSLVCSKKQDYDILLTEDDFNANFFAQLNLLEPFGCDNERPVLAIKQKEMTACAISDKAYKHFKLFTAKNNQITAFNSYDVTEILRSKSEKTLLLDFSKNSYHGKEYRTFLLHGINLDTINFSGLEEQDYLAALYNKYFSIFDFNDVEKYKLYDNVAEIIKQKFNESEFGTLVVASSMQDLEQIKDLNLSDYFSCRPFKNGQNAVPLSPNSIYNLCTATGYKNIIFLHKYFDQEHIYFSQKYQVFEPKTVTNSPFILNKEREIFVKVYNLVNNYKNKKSIDEIDFAKKVTVYASGISASQILFCLIVFMELNFVEFDAVLGEMKFLSAKKMELSHSKFYNEV